MSLFTRRRLIRSLALTPLAAAAQTRQKAKPLDISEYQPHSMLAAPQHPVPKARFPVIDIHTHLSRSKDDVNEYAAPAEELLEVMNRRNLRTMVNLTGGRGAGLRDAIQRFDKAHPGRFLTFTEPWFSRVEQPGFPQWQADQIQQAVRDGARGLKVLKTLGLFLRGSNGKLVTVDDPRFDPMWEACAAARIPVTIHVGDPVAFFTPIDSHNERFEELNNHPDWSFYGKDYPSFREILEARNRMFARHPRTQFVVLHVGNHAEDLADVSGMLDRFSNTTVEIGARIGELGRQPKAARRFIDRYQDRVLFGTDAVPHGKETPQQIFGDELYQIYFRFLETEDEYFDYAPAPVPPQGRWRIYGLGLPEATLRKIYHANAARLLRLTV